MTMAAELTYDVAAFVLDRLRQWRVQQVFGDPGDAINKMVSGVWARLRSSWLLECCQHVPGRSAARRHHAGISDW